MVVYSRESARADPEVLSALTRARAEFLEMPGLKLTTAQAAKLWSLDLEVCRTVLSELVESHFLTVTRDAHFVRAT
jgi:hypothetical protein